MKYRVLWRAEAIASSSPSTGAYPASVVLLYLPPAMMSRHLSGQHNTLTLSSFAFQSFGWLHVTSYNVKPEPCLLQSEIIANGVSVWEVSRLMPLPQPT